MATSWAQKVVRHATRYLGEAFSDPGVLRSFQEEIFQFPSPASIKAFRTITDAHLGGATTATISHDASDGGMMVFHGEYSHEVPPDAPANVHKLGQASVVSEILDGHYIYLGSPERQVARDLHFRLKGDGRLYLAYLKTDSYVQGAGIYDIWQTPIHLRADEWQEVVVPIQNFLLTSDGHVTEEQPDINPMRVAAIGFALAGGTDLQSNGPYRLCIGNIRAGYSADHTSFEG